MGMLAWFVNGYASANLLTPNYILVLFIVSVLALAWALFTVFGSHRSSARFVALADLAFVGAFIGAVDTLRFIASAGDCAHVAPGSAVDLEFGLFGSAGIGASGRADVAVDKTCGMLKACFAFGIMNCVFFFVTAVLAWMHGDHVAAAEERRSYVERASSRHHSHSRHRSRSHGESRRSHSHHSHHRAYV